MKSLVIALWLCCMATSTASAARLYYWTDEQGVKHVSDRKPIEDVEPDQVIIKEPKRDGPSHTSTSRGGALDRLYYQQKANEAQRDATIRQNQEQHEYKVQARKEKHERQIDRLKSRDDYFQTNKDWYKERENNALTERSRQSWKRLREAGERNEQQLRDLQSQ